MATKTIEDALTRAQELRPQYIYLLMQFFPIQVPGMEGVSADRYCRLYYDPEIFSEWEFDWVVSRILIQVEHYVRRHPERQQGRKDLHWNVATDIAVTSTFQSEHLSLHPDTMVPDTFKLPDNLSAEEYYDLLLRLCRKRKQQLLKLGGLKGEAPAPFGSAQSEEAGEWEVPDDEEGIPAVDYLVALEQMSEQPQEKGEAGVQPGDRDIEVQDTRRAVVSWRAQLRGILGSVITNRPGVDDFSFSVPDPDMGLYLHVSQAIMPGMVGKRPNIAVVIDSSGSMRKERLSQCLAEVGQILKTHDASVFVYVVDAAVHSAREVFHQNQIRLHGGGGTDMRKGILAALQQNPRPDVIVVLTDGETPWPETEPRGVKVVIVLMGEDNPPKWAKHVVRLDI